MNPGSMQAAPRCRPSSRPRRRRVAQKTQLTVYTALETDQLKAYENGFTVNPNIELKWVRDSTGVITAKLLAEKANPQADVVMGVAASSLALLDSKGMLIAYTPLNLDAIMSAYRDKKNPPAWFGMDVWARPSASTPSRREEGHPKPETWKDLTKPIYKGQVVMPNPASSGTGYFDVAAWLTLWGDETARAAAGNTWTRCTRTSPSTRTRARSPATWRRPASTSSASRSIPRQQQQGQGRADRPRVPEGRARLGPRGARAS